MSESRAPKQVRVGRPTGTWRRRSARVVPMLIALAWLVPNARAGATVDPPVFTTPDGMVVPNETTVSGTFGMPGWEVEIYGPNMHRNTIVRADGTWTASIFLWPNGAMQIQARGRNLETYEVTGYSAPLTLYVDRHIPFQRFEDDQIREHDHVYGPDEAVPDLRGIAGDDIGVSKIHVRYYDATGKVAHATLAACPACGSRGATSVEWSTTPVQQTGLWAVQIVTEDLVGRASYPDGFQYLRIAAPA